jgi:putative MATE family efflux protein
LVRQTLHAGKNQAAQSLLLYTRTGMADAATRRILEGPLGREIARFGTPLALGMALQTTFNLVDAYLVAQLPKAEVGAAIGALGICDQVAAVGTIISYGVSTATSTLLTNQRGAGDEHAVQRTAWQSILAVAALSVIFAVVGIAFAGPIVRDVIGAKGDVAVEATRYLRVIVGGSFSIFFLLQLTTIQRALGSSKTPVSLLVVGNVLNVFFAILLIFGPIPLHPALAWVAELARVAHVPRMGMVGAAWATVIARSIVLVPNVVILARRFKIVRPPPGERGPDARALRKLASIAWPSSAQFVIRIAAMLLVNSLVARFFTTQDDQTATTAIGLVFRLDTMALFVAMGWGSAAQTFVGQNMGARKEARATKSGWIAAAYDTATNVLLVAAIAWAGGAILRVFDDDPAPVGIALEYLRDVAPSYVGLGIGVVLGNAMAAAGATRTTMLIDAAVILGFQFPACILALAAFGGDRATLFHLVAATNALSAIVYALVYLRGGWRGALGPASIRPAPIAD